MGAALLKMATRRGGVRGRCALFLNGAHVWRNRCWSPTRAARESISSLSHRLDLFLYIYFSNFCSIISSTHSLSFLFFERKMASKFFFDSPMMTKLSYAAGTYTAASLVIAIVPSSEEPKHEEKKKAAPAARRTLLPPFPRPLRLFQLRLLCARPPRKVEGGV